MDRFREDREDGPEQRHRGPQHVDEGVERRPLDRGRTGEREAGSHPLAVQREVGLEEMEGSAVRGAGVQAVEVRDRSDPYLLPAGEERPVLRLELSESPGDRLAERREHPRVGRVEELLGEGREAAEPSCLLAAALVERSGAGLRRLGPDERGADRIRPVPLRERDEVERGQGGQHRQTHVRDPARDRRDPDEMMDRARDAAALADIEPGGIGRGKRIEPCPGAEGRGHRGDELTPHREHLPAAPTLGRSVERVEPLALRALEQRNRVLRFARGRPADRPRGHLHLGKRRCVRQEPGVERGDFGREATRLEAPGATGHPDQCGAADQTVRDPATNRELGEDRAALGKVSDDEIIRGPKVEAGILVDQREVKLSPGREEGPSQDPVGRRERGVRGSVPGHERDDARPGVRDVRHRDDGPARGRQPSAYREFVPQGVLVGPSRELLARSLLEDLEGRPRNPFAEAIQRRPGGEHEFGGIPPAVPNHHVRQERVEQDPAGPEELPRRVGPDQGGDVAPVELEAEPDDVRAPLLLLVDDPFGGARHGAARTDAQWQIPRNDNPLPGEAADHQLDARGAGLRLPRLRSRSAGPDRQLPKERALDGLSRVVVIRLKAQRTHATAAHEGEVPCVDIGRHGPERRGRHSLPGHERPLEGVEDRPVGGSRDPTRPGQTSGPPELAYLGLPAPGVVLGG